MEKRLILAISLSLLVLLSWSGLASRLYHIDNKEVTQVSPLKKPPVPVSAPALVEIMPLETASVSPDLLFTFPQAKTEASFIESQATLREIIFKNYQNYPLVLKNGFSFADPRLVFQKRDSTGQEVTFVAQDQDKQIFKRFNFSNSNYDIWLEIEIKNISGKPLILTKLPLVLGTLNFSGDPNEARLKDMTVSTPEKALHPNGRKEMVFPAVSFISLRDRYFCAIIEPKSGPTAGFIHKISPQESEIGLNLNDILLEPGKSYQEKFHIYLGPQELGLINRANPEWSLVAYYGTFNFISHVLLQALNFIYQLVHNWGITIILFTILIYLLLYPLTLKQMRSMKDMQAMQPHIEELRKTYKDNPRKLNEEIMKLYKEHKVNPLGGCLPLILQIPVFFALYQALIRSVALKGASFLWIKDLSLPDRLFILPRSLPAIGNEINILPLLMMVGMFIQQKISAVATSAEAAEQQKIMLVVFPLMFGFIFYHMPAGLVLYWFMNSTLMLIQQLRTRASH